MDRAWTLIVFTALAWSLAAAAQAQPPRPDRPGPDHRPTPPATVVARVKVNVETEVDVANDAASAKVSEEEEEDDEDESDEDEDNGGFGELIEALLKQPGSGSGVQVFADININVETSIKVRGHSMKPPGPKLPPGSDLQKVKPDTPDEKKVNPAPDTTPPRKKKNRKKGAKKPAETSETPKSAEPSTSLSLSRIKIGENLEFGVTGQLGSEERAKEIANRINAGKSQSLLGMAVVGMMVPEQSDSLRVLQKAISSVRADASGSELSVSAAIPKETPWAVKTLVEAALKKE